MTAIQPRNVLSTSSSTTTVRARARVATIEVAGELDMLSCSALERTLDHELLAGRSVFLDLSRVRFIDLTVTEVILRASTRGSIALVGSMPPDLKRVLQLLRVDGELASADGQG